MEKEFRRAVVMGCACIVTSRFTVEELEKFHNYLPDALVLKGDSGEELYKIEIQEEISGGCILEDHICYSRAKTPEGKATVTLLIDPEAEDKAVVIGEAFGPALLLLEKLEQQLLSRVAELEEKTARINGLICRP